MSASDATISASYAGVTSARHAGANSVRGIGGA